MSRNNPRPGNVAVVVAHPGHELVIHHYMELHRPLYCCLTDGSGTAAQSRLASTTRLLHSLGATPGPIYGRFSDREIYQFLLDHRVEVFAGLLNELAASLIEQEIQCVAGDAMEGFNPSHDLCRALIDRAVEVVEERTGRRVQNYEFAVHGVSAEEALLRLDLDDESFERKLSAAMAYAEVRSEVDSALDRLGRQSFAVEYLRASSTGAMLQQFENTPPSYETIGESRVREGRYREVVRYREHVFPVFKALGIVDQ